MYSVIVCVDLEQYHLQFVLQYELLLIIFYPTAKL